MSVCAVGFEMGADRTSLEAYLKAGSELLDPPKTLEPSIPNFHHILNPTQDLLQVPPPELGLDLMAAPLTDDALS